MLPKRPNSKIELKINKEIRAIKSLFSQNGSVAKMAKYKIKINKH
jgi:hypothetical protein